MNDRIADSNRINGYASEMKQFRKRTLDKLLPAQSEEVADVGDSTTTNIDSPQHHHYYLQPAAKPSGLGKMLVGAGLLAAGIGGPLTGYLVADALKPKPDPPPVVQPAEPELVEPEIIDNSKTFDWRVGDPIID